MYDFSDAERWWCSRSKRHDQIDSRRRIELQMKSSKKPSYSRSPSGCKLFQGPKNSTNHRNSVPHVRKKLVAVYLMDWWCRGHQEPLVRLQLDRCLDRAPWGSALCLLNLWVDKVNREYWHPSGYDDLIMTGLNRSVCPCLVPKIYPNASVCVRLQLCLIKTPETPLLVLIRLYFTQRYTASIGSSNRQNTRIGDMLNFGKILIGSRRCLLERIHLVRPRLLAYPSFELVLCTWGAWIMSLTYIACALELAYQTHYRNKPPEQKFRSEMPVRSEISGAGQSLKHSVLCDYPLCLGACLSNSVEEQVFIQSFLAPKCLCRRESLVPITQRL